MDSKNLVNREKKQSPSSPIVDIVVTKQKSQNLRLKKSKKKSYVQPSKDEKSIDYTIPSRNVDKAHLQESASMSLFEALSQEQKNYFSEISSNVIGDQNLGNIYSKVSVSSISVSEEKNPEPPITPPSVNFQNLFDQHIGMSDYQSDGGGEWHTVRTKRSNKSKRKLKSKRRKTEIIQKKTRDQHTQLTKEKAKTNIQKNVVISVQDNSPHEESRDIEISRQGKSFVSIVKDWDCKGGNYDKLIKELKYKETKKKEMEKKKKEIEKKKKEMEKKKKMTRISPALQRKQRKIKEQQRLDRVTKENAATPNTRWKVYTPGKRKIKGRERKQKEYNESERKRIKEKRDSMDEDQKKEKKERARKRMKDKRDSLDEDQKKKENERESKRLKDKRDSQDEDQKKKENERDRKRKKEKSDSKDGDQKKDVNVRERE